jgi:hypothetical protein
VPGHASRPNSSWSSMKSLTPLRSRGLASVDALRLSCTTPRLNCDSSLKGH